jgi:hypothetical protein
MAPKFWGLVLAATVASSAAGAEAPRAASAQKAAEQPPARPRRTVIHFGEDDIRGDITRPDGELVQAPRRVAEGTLLRMRRSFIDRALSGAARGE